MEEGGAPAMTQRTYMAGGRELGRESKQGGKSKKKEGERSGPSPSRESDAASARGLSSACGAAGRGQGDLAPAGTGWPGRLLLSSEGRSPPSPGGSRHRRAAPTAQGAFWRRRREGPAAGVCGGHHAPGPGAGSGTRVPGRCGSVGPAEGWA